MLTKVVEVHDDSLKVRVLAVKLIPANDGERAALVDRSGFNPDGSTVLLIELDSETATSDPHQWPSLGVHPRTLPVAHVYIRRNFDLLAADGVEVINVADILDADLDPLLGSPIDPEGQ